MPDRVLVLQLKRLGDLILTAPLIGALRHQLPKAQITLVTVDGAGELAELIEGVDQHLRFQRGRPNGQLWRGILAARPDLVLDVTGNDRSAFMSLLSRGKQRAGFQQQARGLRQRVYTDLNPSLARERHTVDHHLSLLETVGLDPAFQGWSVTPFPKASGEPYVLLHPGTAREEKFWRPERWAEVIDFLAAQNLGEIRVTHGPGEFEAAHVDAILKNTTASATPVTGLSLKQFAQQVAQAGLVISVDTVASHLAAVYERPQVVLFGPINPYQWRPRHKMARVIWAGHDHPITEFVPKVKNKDLPEMDALSTAAVLEGIQSLKLA